MIMIANYTDLERLLERYQDNQAFLYLESIHFEHDDIARNGIFIENEQQDALVDIFLYAKNNELVTTGGVYQLLCDGKRYLLELLEMVEEDDRVLVIKERVAKTCEGLWSYAKDGNIVSKDTHSYTVWAVGNDVKFKSENREFLLHLIPDLKFLMKKRALLNQKNA